MESKSWYQSITIWAGAFVAVLQFIPAIIAEVDKVVSADLAASPTVIKILSVVAAIVAIYGRFTAKSVIK